MDFHKELNQAVDKFISLYSSLILASSDVEEDCKAAALLAREAAARRIPLRFSFPSYGIPSLPRILITMLTALSECNAELNFPLRQSLKAALHSMDFSGALGVIVLELPDYAMLRQHFLRAWLRMQIPIGNIQKMYASVCPCAGTSLMSDSHFAEPESCAEWHLIMMKKVSRDPYNISRELLDDMSRLSKLRKKTCPFEVLAEIFLGCVIRIHNVRGVPEELQVNAPPDSLTAGMQLFDLDEWLTTILKELKLCHTFWLEVYLSKIRDYGMQNGWLELTAIKKIRFYHHTTNIARRFDGVNFTCSDTPQAKIPHRSYGAGQAQDFQEITLSPKNDRPLPQIQPTAPTFDSRTHQAYHHEMYPSQQFWEQLVDQFSVINS